MAVIDWQEIWQGRGGEMDQIKAIRRYERTFRVITDTPADGPSAILLDAEFLGLLAAYVDAVGQIDFGSLLRNVRVTQPEQDNPNVWLLTYEYSSEPLDVQQHATIIQDPLLRPPIFTLDIAKYQRVVDRDYLGTPISNSAGAPFSPLPEVDDTRFVLTMERNEAEPDWQLILSYQDAVNSDIFLGFAAGTAKVNIKASSQFENNQYFWKVMYTFEFRNVVTIQGKVYSGWDLHLLDQGFYQLDSNNKARLILDPQGNPLNDPVLLDGQGHQAQPNAVPVYLHFRPYNWLPFSVFDFPEAIL